jgi:AraC family transcriptional regulator
LQRAAKSRGLPGHAPDWQTETSSVVSGEPASFDEAPVDRRWANTSESNGRVNSSLAKPGLALPPEQPVGGQERGVGNHGSGGLLASSAGRSWSGVAAELRSHSGVIAWRNPGPDTEICVDVHGGASVVTRQRDGITDRTVSERGTIWLSPAGRPEGLIEISNPLPAILHIYLPPSQFLPTSLGEGSDPSAVASLRFESSFQDPLVAEMAYAITSELQRETSVGSMLIETLASSLAARLVQNHVGTLVRDVSARAAQAGLDRRRLTRVLDYIGANLEGDLTTRPPGFDRMPEPLPFFPRVQGRGRPISASLCQREAA